jgi:hypothetical protein
VIDVQQDRMLIDQDWLYVFLVHQECFVHHNLMLHYLVQQIDCLGRQHVISTTYLVKKKVQYQTHFLKNDSHVKVLLSILNKIIRKISF